MTSRVSTSSSSAAVPRTSRRGSHGGARAPSASISRAAQLDSARRCQQQYGIDFPLLEADAASVPLPDASFDLVVSEYGASVWCDPERWVREAARLLRPRGRLVFLTNSVLATLCVPEEEGETQDQLLRPQRDLNRVQWPGGGVEFHPGHGDWIRILRANGFEVEALHELYANRVRPEPRLLLHLVGAMGGPVADRRSLGGAPSMRHTAQARFTGSRVPTRCG